jgi:cytoskeletal protein RodZ
MAITVGGVLQQARKDADVTLERVAAKTKIRVRFLEAIEADDFDRLPDGVVRRGHLRAYAREVGLDPEQIVARYLREQASRRPPAGVVTPESTPRLHLEARHAQLRSVLLVIDAAYHRSVRAAHRALLRALHGTTLPQ